MKELADGSGILSTFHLSRGLIGDTRCPCPYIRDVPDVRGLGRVGQGQSCPRPAAEAVHFRSFHFVLHSHPHGACMLTTHPSFSLTGLLSFMLSDEMTTGSVTSTDAHKRAFAARSHAWNLTQPRFREAFPEVSSSRSLWPSNEQLIDAATLVLHA